MIILASDNIGHLAKWGEALRGELEIIVAASVDDLMAKVAQKPSLVAIDRGLVTAELLNVVRQIRKISPSTKILLQCNPSQTPSDEEDLALLKAGVRGFCSSDMDSAAIQRIVQAIDRGQVWVRRSFILSLIDELAKRAPALVEGGAFESGIEGGSDDVDRFTEGDDPLAVLTPREREIALMIGKGECNKRIASALDITERTVKAHLTLIFRKLNIADRVHLALLVSQKNH